MRSDRQTTSTWGGSQRVRRGVIVILALATVLALGLSTEAIAEETFEVTAVPAGGDAGYVSSDGDRVVWFEGDLLTMEYGSINTWTPTEGVTEIVSGGGLSEPSVSGDRIVWRGPEHEGSLESDMFTWTPEGDVLQIVHHGWDDRSGQVDGDRIVWEGWPVIPPVVPVGAVYDSEIFTWTPPTPDGGGGLAPLTNNAVLDGQPDVSGDRVVWMTFEPTQPASGGPVTDIMTIVVGDGNPAQQLDDPDNHYSDNMEPKVSGNRVVWWGTGDTSGVLLPQLPDGQEITLPDPDGEVYTWTPDSGRVRITDNSTWDVMPEVDGDRVTYWGEGGVYSWTPTEGIVLVEATGTEYESPPEVSGDRVVWPGSVSTWTPGAGTTEVSSTESPIGYWNVSGDRLVWSTVDENGYMQIFTAVPAVQASQTPIPATTSTGTHTRYEQTEPLIVYSGNWETDDSKSHSGGSGSYSDDSQATITITFKGTRLDWIAALGPLMGKALVSIDGGAPVLVDLFNPTELFQQLVWSTGTLEYGVHVIKITFPTDGGEVKPINLDALDVWGTLLETTES